MHTVCVCVESSCILELRLASNSLVEDEDDPGVLFLLLPHER